MPSAAANPSVQATPAPATPDSAKTGQSASQAVDATANTEAKPLEFKRDPPDRRLFNDPRLAAKEYGAGILGSVVAGTLCFYIGSGIETAIVGETDAHKGTLKFTGIRYDNYKGAFWGGATRLGA